MLAIAIVLMTVLTMQSAARPLGSPQLGSSPDGNYSENGSLWSGDRDRLDESPVPNGSEGNRSAEQLLTAVTDIPYNRPPNGVARWNRQDIGDFPNTGRHASAYPSNTTRQNGTFLKDAHASVFTVQPATTASLSADEQRRYVTSDGQLLGTVDYRVVVPPGTNSPGRRVSWNLTNHSISEARLFVDDTLETRRNGSRTPRLPYSLARHPGDEHTLTLEANITVELGRTIERCTEYNKTDNCSTWESTRTVRRETLTVNDSVNVTEYSLETSGFRARYPDGDLALVVYSNEPWLGYSLPAADVNGVWRFYSARDPDWDRLVTNRANESMSYHSPLHPLRVHAYPIETGPTATPRGTVSIDEVFGRDRQPPPLPDTVNLDTLTTPYTSSYGIVTRLATPDLGVSDVTATGLVRGTAMSPDPESFAEVPIHRSNLSLAVVNKSATTVTIQVTLTDVATGASIATTDRDGSIHIQGKQVQTTAGGTVTTTIPRPGSAIRARYEPGNWWQHDPGYVSDTDTVSVQGTVLGVVQSVYRFGVPVTLFLLAVLLIDRITGVPVWPPWRGL